jgi:hypothetical protein
MDALPQLGKLHTELAISLGSGMNRLRASILGYVEMLGLPPDQTQAFKTAVRVASTQFWTEHETAMKSKIEACASSLLPTEQPNQKQP